MATLRAALALNPANAVATNLQSEVRKRRALAPAAAERASTGFARREFTLLETLPPEEACRALAPRIDALLGAVNASSVADRILAVRQRAGVAGSKLFHAGAFEAFRRTLDWFWKRELARWMAANGGFLQYGSNGPSVDVLPERAVEWLLACRNPAAVEWIFVGR